ncbi:MAG: hypothetical protein MR703_00105, partial [Prevotella sp.]|nr:hypothetical protein [Prevotella sp.]
GLGFAACQSKKGNTLIIRLLPLQGVGVVWRIFTQGAALGYVLLPLRGVLLASFDTPPIANRLFCYSIHYPNIVINTSVDNFLLFVSIL